MKTFIKQTFLAKDRFLPFHTESLCLIFDSTGSQKEYLDGLSPIGRPE